MRMLAITRNECSLVQRRYITCQPFSGTCTKRGLYNKNLCRDHAKKALKWKIGIAARADSPRAL
jgi:hypothetical protein